MFVLVDGIVAKISVIIECVKFIVFFVFSSAKWSSSYRLVYSWGNMMLDFLLTLETSAQQVLCL